MNYASRTVTAAPAIDLAEEKAFRVGPLLVRPSTREIVAEARSQIIEPRVMQALVVLAQADGAVVSRDRLIERCWGGRIVGDDAINNCIGKVRSLAALTSDPAFEIETVPRVGYRLVASQPNDASTEVLQPTLPSLQAAISAPVGATTSGRRRHFGLRKVAVLAVLAIVIVAAAAFLLRRFAEPSRRPSLPPGQTTVAVLPFTPLYSDRNAGVYADEISSDVADTLGQTDLNVISPALSFRFRGDTKAGAAKALHADILVDGDVRRNGGNFDVAVRVEDVASGLVLLSKNIVAPAAQASDLPDRVATFIAGALGWDFSIRALASGKRWDPRIRTGVLRALFQCPHRQDPFCSYEIGRTLVSLAPDNAIAQTILAIETTNILDRLPDRERRPAIARARKAAWDAIRLEPHMGEPYIALSELSSSRALKGVTAAAEIYLRRGLSVDPDSSSLAGYLSGLLYSAGRDQEALSVTQRVAARYKFEDWTSTNQAWALLALGETGNAVKIAKRGRRLWPDTWLFVLMLFDATAFGGDLNGAEAMLRDPATAPMLHASGEQPTVPHILRALRRHRAEDIDAVSQDCSHVKDGDWPHLHVCVLALSLLGRVDDAFHLPLEGLAQFVLFWPQTAPLRADPRFVGLAEKLGLMAYWKATHARPDFCATEKAPVCRVLASGH